MSTIQEPDAEAKYAEIQKFRLITSILSELPHSTVLDIKDHMKDPNVKPKQRETIRVCDALAQSLVMKHEIVSVTANRRYEVDAAGTLYVAAVSAKDSEKIEFAEASNATPTPSWTASALAKVQTVLQFFCSVNPTKPIEKPYEVKLPECVKSEAPPGVTKDNVLDHMLSLQKNWDFQPTIQQHLWMITNAMIAKSMRGLSLDKRLDHRTVLGERLTRYIIGACHQKIRHRFNNDNLSLPYLNALKDVDVTGLPPVSIMRFSPNDNPNASNKMKSDRRFLLDFVIKMDVEDKTTTKIPTLIAKAKELSEDENEFFQLYTNETRDEFHAYLIELLEDFRTSLDELAVSSITAEKRSGHLAKLYRSGYLLHRLSRGSAFQMHLNSILPRLERILKLPKQESSHGVDIDVELTVLRRLPLDRAYTTWLRVNVGHFDSAESLSKFATSPLFGFNDVQASLLVLEPLDNELPPWTDLFKENILTGTAPPGGDVTTTNAMIRQFLEKYINDALFHDSYCDDLKYIISNMGERKSPSKVKIRINEMQKKIKDRTKEITEAIRKKTKDIALEATDPYFYFSKDDLEDSLLVLAPLSEGLVSKVAPAVAMSQKAREVVNSWYEMQLGVVATQSIFVYLGKKKLFSGTVHCEAYLASLLPLHPPSRQPQFASIHNILKSFTGQEIGVSKLCCPICDSYLGIIQRDVEQKYLWQGAHDHITACSLPPWTKLEYLQAMNQHWGAVLRNDLLRLMEVNSHRRRARSLTTGSMGRASNESLGTSAGPSPHNNLVDTY